MRIFIGNIPFETQDAELRALFELCGAVADFAIVRDRGTRKSKGYGFAVMPDARQAWKAIAALNGRTLGGRVLIVDEARERPAPRYAPRQGRLDAIASR